MDLRDYTPQAITGLIALIAGLLGWRGVARVRTDNARDFRVSRHEDNIQKRYDDALAKNSELRDEIDTARSQLAVRERELKEARGRIRALLGMLSPEDRDAAARWMPSQLDK
jgi:hypothetical protein